MRFSVEAFEHWYREAAPLFRAHWELVGSDREQLPLDPQWSRWIELERAGALLAVTARIGWRLHGYSLHLVAPSLLYGGRLVATSHALYIEPAELTGMRALRLSRLVAFADAELGRRGVVKTYHGDKPAHSLGPVLARNGYTLEEQSWGRLLT